MCDMDERAFEWSPNSIECTRDRMHATATPSWRFQIMAKPTGAICNLDCEYCYFLSKELLYPGSSFRMSDEVLDTYVRQLLEAHDGTDLAIAWQGGEPTLIGLDFFERAVALVERHRRPDQRVEHTIQTNGTLLDDKWAAFFRRHNFLVGISIDGPKKFHDAYRVNKAGRGTFDQVHRAWELLRGHGIDVNVLCTVHAANGDHGHEVYTFFRDTLGAHFMQFIPVVERVISNEGLELGPGRPRRLYTQDGDQVSRRSVKAEQFGQFLVEVFEEWSRRDIGRVFVQLFDVTLGAHLGQYSLCVHAPTCGDALALEHNGDLYSCDHYVEPSYRLGNIQTTHMLKLIRSQQQRQFGLAKRDTLPRYCRECDVRFACNGGCPRDRFSTTPDGEAGLNYLCAGYMRFFRHSGPRMVKMVDFVRGGLPPATLMDSIRKEDRQRGRNDICPCGSGRKWKRCHGEVTTHGRHANRPGVA
jgi:uncharacterized protein